MAERGRPSGSRNKRTLDAGAFVKRIEKRLAEKGSPHGLESVAEELLTCGDPKVISVVWSKLMEYKYGKPTQPIEATGPNGSAIEVVIRRAS